MGGTTYEPSVFESAFCGGELEISCGTRAVVGLGGRRSAVIGIGLAFARAFYAGPDMLVCEMRDVLLPAERRMLSMGDLKPVTDTRTSFQAATRDEFIAAIEALTGRRVVAFASAINPVADVVWENFSFARAPGLPTEA